MAKINVINVNGEKVKDLTINDNIWDIKVNDIILKKAIDLQLASLRQGTAKTKTRAEVRGGGRKPWRQKGTGRARSGSTRSPIWRGGGIIFGVTPRSYTFKMNKKEKDLALRSALSDKYQVKDLVVIDEIKVNSLKTKDMVSLIDKLKLTGKVLFVTKDDQENLFMGIRNLPNAYSILANEINVLDLVNADTLVFDEAAMKSLEEVLG